MKIGILNETKTPHDKRCPFAPGQLADLAKRYPGHRFVVQAGDQRAFRDEEFSRAGISVTSNLDDCDVLMGVKEPVPESLIKGKTYLFFSHTAKEQPHNRVLLQKAAKLGITLIDYEYLAENGQRVVAFGYWAGLVGAYNTLRGYGILSDEFSLRPPEDCFSKQELIEELHEIDFAIPVHAVITGEGRVASGAVEVMEEAGFTRVSAEVFLSGNSPAQAYCRIGPQHYTRHKKGKDFDFDHFVDAPQEYRSVFQPYLLTAELFIACHFWDPRGPRFFSRDCLREPGCKLKIVGDISCDIPGPIPTTIRASTIEAPFYGINRSTGRETEPFLPAELTVMAVDNLPGSLPRDASYDFGKQLTETVMPQLLGGKESPLIKGATILRSGKLTPAFSYLKDYLEG